MKEQLTRIENKVDKIHEAVHGNGKVGLRIRIDRLERTSAGRTKTLWLVLVASIGVLGKMITDMVK